VIPAVVRIFVCTEPVDMRQGFDRLMLAAREKTQHDPQGGGALFVFANRGATRIKVLWFERNGCCILYKRLHRAVFELPVSGGAASVHIDSAALARLLAGTTRTPKRSRRSREEPKARASP
jgi:transposase